MAQPQPQTTVDLSAVAVVKAPPPAVAPGGEYTCDEVRCAAQKRRRAATSVGAPCRGA